MAKIIDVTNLNYRYPQQTEHPALKDVNFSVDQGEWVAIIGHNGSGKSTLAKSIDGLLPIGEGDSGTIKVGGITLTEDSVWDIRKKIGMVFQNPDNQFVGATVEDDVAFGLENHGMPREEMVTRVHEALKRVRMLEFAKREPARLSGGQKQRVAIAGVIAQQPDIIILDEATSMLDPEGRVEVLEIVRKLKEEENMTVLSITHDIDETENANRIIVLDDGQLQESGTPEKIFAYGNRLIAMGLDVPYAERLRTALRKRGTIVPAQYLNEEGMVDWLWTSHLKM
ncbi:MULTISPECIES: energy-coupling factor ABC transporter ATP-binding protein [Loigolactobacillus]|uniref:Energy-coupling factor transporter ATPase n=1 Tax=Loigolactobacillus backii TaxID=375175 RepID=A0A192H395_9LACO|nr:MULTISPECIES: energy-coupling factor ABC transporter ATP-binding protein [Loigolactobacillus]ANK60129.1 energy-coupling factor transporter ATPase [Loigolactobacillus backii]ANK62431.1 energy-coupling factor transporter ATPase [Loigolactobacillus backii]ANK65011.1 energy-coupling factor transporter ATPase [Loigolactobacillus backii]ANK67568.1 energy-coupling factor transporter ATPase [Loigolactobacillus backii]ANK70557.1 energy-coupling factor transporter ATPase [Loigolactobacillus backii]